MTQLKLPLTAWDPENDGVDHINVYSKGRTELGRWLSNFAHEPIVTEDGPFVSIEGYWYWLGTGDEQLRGLAGFAAKAHGSKLPVVQQFTQEAFRRKIGAAIRVKAACRPDMVSLLAATTLPLAHYYVFGSTIKDAGYKWILEVWDTLRA